MLLHLFPAACPRYSPLNVPTMASVAPTSGVPGTAINITGANLAAVVDVRFMQQGNNTLQLAAVCSVSAAESGWVVCASAPSLEAGTYTLVLARANGELSVDGLKVTAIPNPSLVVWIVPRCRRVMQSLSGEC